MKKLIVILLMVIIMLSVYERKHIEIPQISDEGAEQELIKMIDRMLNGPERAEKEAETELSEILE
jgi:hypothetical protein